MGRPTDKTNVYHTRTPPAKPAITATASPASPIDRRPALDGVAEAAAWLPADWLPVGAALPERAGVAT